MALEPYVPTQWAPQTPITQGRMDHLEEGVRVNRENLNSAMSTIDQHTTEISQRPTTTVITALIDQQAGQGTRAYAEIVEAHEGDNYTSLENRFLTDEAKTAAVKAMLGTKIVDNESVDAYSSTNTVYSNVNSIKINVDLALAELRSARTDGISNITYDSLYAHLNNMDSDIDVLKTNVTTINAAAGQDTQGNDLTLAARIRQLQAIQDEIDAAHREVEQGAPVDTLAQRFASIDTLVAQLRIDVNALDTNKVSKTDVVDDFEHTDTQKPLSANKGKELKDTIGGTYSAINTVAAGITSAATTAENNAKTYADTNKIAKTNIYNALDYVPDQNATDDKVLDARQGKALNDRLSSAESEIAAAKTSSIITDTTEETDENTGETTTVTTPHTYTFLDDRLEAIESYAAAVRTDVDTIANELSMVNSQTGAIQATNSRVDTIEANVVAIGKEIGMLQDEASVVDLSTAVSRTDTRVDSIETEINNAHRTLDNGTDTLDNRFDDIEGRLDTLDDDQNGVIAGLDARLDAIDGGSVLINDSTLISRVTTLEGKDTIVKDKPNSGSNYTNGKPNNIAVPTPSIDADYLIADDKGKYFYWRYFGPAQNQGWQLISGAGGSGSGTSSGVISNTLPEIQNANENTDYYIGDNTTGYLHYRLTTIDNVQQFVLIGVNPNKVKQYNIAKIVKSEKNYLRLFEYDYDERNNSIDDNLDEDDWVANTTYEIGDRVIYSGYVYECITANEDEEWTANNWERYSNIRIVNTIELPEGGGSGGGATIRFISIPPTNMTTITGGDAYIHFFYSSIEEGNGIDAHYILTNGNGIQLDEGDLTSGNEGVNARVWPENLAEGIIYHEGEYVGFGSINVKPYYMLGNNTFTMSIETKNHDTRERDWSVSVKELRLECSSPDFMTATIDEPITINYTPYGAMEKTLYIKVDNQIIDSLVLSGGVTGTEWTYDIPKQTAGPHTIEMYLTATINGQVYNTKDSNPIIKEYVWYNSSSQDKILTSPYRRFSVENINALTEWVANTSYQIGDLVKVTTGNKSIGYICKTKNNDSVFTSKNWNVYAFEVQQYDDIELPYSIQTNSNDTYQVKHYYDYIIGETNTPIEIMELSGTQSNVVKTAVNDFGNHNIAIEVDNQILIININVVKLPMTISSVPGAIIDFNPANLNNNSINRLPSWKTNTTAFDEYPEWIAGTEYEVGDHVIYEGYAYECKTANEDETWTEENWNEQGVYEYRLITSDNFNWSKNENDSGGGYREDEDGKCFVIKAGTTARINYKMFQQNNTSANGVTTTTSSVFDNGAEMKIIFKVAAVRDASATWFKNMGTATDQDSKQIGIQLRAHEGWLKTDKAAITNAATSLTDEELSELSGGYPLWVKGTSYEVGDIVVRKDDAIIYRCITANSDTKWSKKKWQSLGQVETEVSATNSYLYFPYSEEDRIELDININKENGTDDFIMSYEDGVPSKAYPYKAGNGGDILYHQLKGEADIVIGSPDCDVYIYRLRIYNKSLTTEQVLRNFIADGKNIGERVARYKRNSIYYKGDIKVDTEDEKYSPYSNEGTLDPYHLASRMPDVKILMLEAPRFTMGKKDFIKNSTLRCIQASGGKVYPGTDKDNWYFFHGYHAGQGTTSDNYGQSARNVDFLFECDGTHYPTKSDNLNDFEVGYQSKLVVGNSNSVYDEANTKSWQVKPGVTSETCTHWMGNDCKISLTHDADTEEDTSIPNNYFNLKVNVASSENVNNALFQKRYNDFLPYDSPAKLRDSRIKNDMEFVPAVLFIRETGPIESHREFNDTNWHFYALGNIGDSKKTDYTRAYNPNDMNEFTVEISDNNTANSQFQSGWYKDDGVDTLETIEIADDPTVDQDPMKYQYPISTENWNLLRDATADEIKALKKSGSDIKLPEGKTYVNYRHHKLVADPFDGDHSFEFRYACKGDYRDGDLINDMSDPIGTGETDDDGKLITFDDLQFNINRNVWFAFYEWVVTSTPAQFRAEAAQWFVPEAIEFFYAFTHYYTMMDNRAKNTFWHFAQTGKRRRVSRPVPELFHIYEVAEGNVSTNAEGICTGTFLPATGTFNPNGEYYTQYAFDLWTYDTDTAAGIDNNGEFSFPYGKEDRDYRVADQPNSGWAFNGAGSIFWRRLRESNANGGFEEEIAALMRKEDECFAEAYNLINQFDQFQECYPEEIWRLDIERKYIRTFTGLPMDSSITTNKQNIRFLRAMMQGRKKYQRRQWIRNQAVYFGSKYGLSNVHTSNHTIEFVTYTPVAPNGGTLPVPADQSNLILVPYQDMYIDVATGNSTTNLNTAKLERAKAGDRVRVDCRSGGGSQETRVYIFGGEYISSIENLAQMYIGEHSFELGKHLKVLNLGSDNPEYNNQNLDSLTVSKNMPLLETLNIKNCNMLSGAPDLSESNNLRVIEAEGSALTGISLPAYTNIKTLHLPDTVQNIVLDSAYNLTDFRITHKDLNANQIFTEDYSNLLTLRINDSDYSNINWLDIALQTLDEKIDVIYLQNLKNSSINNINELDPFVEKKQELEVNTDNQGNLIIKLLLSGTIKVNGEWSSTEIQSYQNIWNDLDFDTNPENEVVRYKIIYKYDDNTKNGRKIHELYITPELGDTTLTIPEIYSSNAQQTIISLPEKPETKEYKYTFGTLNNVQAYRAYSGWAIRTINGLVQLNDTTKIVSLNTIDENTHTIIVETVFNATPQSYPIYWYLNPNDANPVYTSKNKNGNEVKVEYGKSFNGHIPNVQDINAAGRQAYELKYSGNNVGYRVFNGWQQAPINLTNPVKINNEVSAYKIYANWFREGMNENNIVDNTLTTIALASRNNLDVGKLLLLSKNENFLNTNYIDTNDRISIQMGYNGVDGGTSLINNPEIFNEDRTLPLVTQCRPFNSTNDAFTIAIDYQFDMNHIVYNNTTRELVLAGCYENNNGSIYGFRLYYDTYSETGSVRLGFGDPITNQANQSKIIQDNYTAQYRNIIVLRHPSNSNTLYIYSGVRINNSLEIFNNIDEDGYEQTLTWNNITTNANLVLGGISSSSITNIENAYGTIYWAKYWNEDLGAGECRMLANWPHENIEFMVEDYKGISGGRVLSTLNEYTLPNISLAPMNISSYIGPMHRPLSKETYSNRDYVGWHNSWYRTYVNQRYFFGLPIMLQSIISKTPLLTRQLLYNGVYSLAENDSTTLDYIFLPSRRELTDVQGNYDNYKTEASRRYVWNINTNVTIYNYDESNAKFKTAPETSESRFLLMNLRFPGKALGNSIRVFGEYTGTNSVYDIINGEDFELQSGDIFVTAQERVAYMYVSSEEILAGTKIMPNSGKFACTTGGWIRAENWYTRSVFSEIQQTKLGTFIFADTEGKVSTEAMIPKQLSNNNGSSNDQISANLAGACLGGSFGI